MSAGTLPAAGLAARWARWPLRGWATRLRLLAGLTMFTFVSTHLLNHSLGLVSLDAMLAGQRVFFAAWHGLPGSSLLLLALLTHLTLVLYKQVVRRTLRMPWVEGIRILLGFTTLYALLYHAVPNVVFRLVFGKPLLYPDFLHTLSADPWLLANQLTLVTAAWSHGCIGLHLWLRLRAPYRRALPVIMAVAVLVPALALLGVLSGAREADERAGHASPGGSYGSSGASAGGDYGSSATSGDYGSYGASDAYGGGGTTVFDLHWLHVSSLVGVTVFFASLIAIRLGLQAWERRRGQVTVRYPGGRQVSATRGASVLEISRIGRVPHASVCGGRGRCSTCRVRVDAGWEHLPAPDDEEVRLLGRIKAPERVRLACQLRPESDIAVTLLVPANARPRDALPYDRMLFGSEQEIVILFADLRGFTKMSENKLPYDVVHILNQYFAEMGEAIESAGGYLDKFIGDGIMALFGLRDGVQAGALNALAAARAMGRRLDELNGRLTLDLAQPLRLGIGIHVGHVIVGEMGYKRATSLTAIGDAVNVASRLESATKIANCQLLVSADVAARAGADLSAFPLQELKVPGRAEALRVYVIAAAVDLPALAGGAALPGGGVVRGATDRPV